MSNKQIVIEAMSELPDEATLEEISEHIALLASVRGGEEAADERRVVSHDEAKKRAADWLDA